MADSSGKCQTWLSGSSGLAVRMKHFCMEAVQGYCGGIAFRKQWMRARPMCAARMPGEEKE